MTCSYCRGRSGAAVERDLERRASKVGGARRAVCRVSGAGDGPRPKAYQRFLILPNVGILGSNTVLTSNICTAATLY